MIWKWASKPLYPLTTTLQFKNKSGLAEGDSLKVLVQISIIHKPNILTSMVFKYSLKQAQDMECVFGYQGPLQYEK